MDFRDTTLYACGSEGGDIAGLVRFDDERRARWDPSARAISWVNPGGRQRAYGILRVITDSADRFVFEDDQGRRHELRELTPAHYNEHVRRPDAPRLQSPAELLAAFEASLR